MYDPFQFDVKPVHFGSRDYVLLKQMVCGTRNISTYQMEIDSGDQGGTTDPTLPLAHLTKKHINSGFFAHKIAHQRLIAEIFRALYRLWSRSQLR